MTVLVILFATLAGCAGGKSYDDGEDVGYTDADADADGDTDSDGDTDTDTDADADADTDGDIDLDGGSDGDTDADSDSDTGTGVDPGPEQPDDVELLHSCTPGSGPFTSHVADEWTEPELHIVGVYEGTLPHDETSEISVHVSRGYEMVLVVSSYESVNWTITVDDDTTLTQVIVNGYDESTAVVPDGVELDERSGGGSYFEACAYAWPGDAGGCDTANLVSAIESETDLELTSFSGCYQGTSFEIAED